MSMARVVSLRISAALVGLQLVSGCATGGDGGRSSLPPVGQGPEAHRKEAIDLIQVMNMERHMTQIIDQTISMQLTADPNLLPFQDILREFLFKYMSWKSLEADFVRIYVETFTAQELRDLADFYRTPTGKKALETMPKLMEKGAKIGQQRVQEHIPELQETVQRRVQALQSGE